MNCRMSTQSHRVLKSGPPICINLFHSFKTTFKSTLPWSSGHLSLELPWVPTQRGKRSSQHRRFQEATEPPFLLTHLLLHNCLHPGLAPLTTVTACKAPCQNLDAKNSEETVLSRQPNWCECFKRLPGKELCSIPSM